MNTKWFRVLVVEGALLTGCAKNGAPDEAGDTSSRDDASEVEGDEASTEPDGVCAAAVCEDTSSWSECTADGVMCCWAAGDCCDPCCGHLSP